MSQTSIAAEIATRVAKAERKAAIALGHDALDVFDRWSVAYFETFNRMWEPSRPAVWPRTDATVSHPNFRARIEA